MATGVRTLSMRQTSKQVPEGGVGQVIETVFMVDDDGPFVVDTPVEAFGVDTVPAKVQEFADKVRATRSGIASVPPSQPE